MFEGIGGSLSNFMNSAGGYFSSAGNAMGFGENGAIKKYSDKFGGGLMALNKVMKDPTSATDEDKAVFQGMLGMSNGQGTLTKAITGKEASDYTKPTNPVSASVDLGKNPSDQTANPVDTGQKINGTNKTTGQQATSKAKQLSGWQKFAKIGQALHGITMKKGIEAPMVHAQRGAMRINKDKLANTLAARDFNEIYTAPTTKKHWGSY